jgi:hypothetical protein
MQAFKSARGSFSPITYKEQAKLNLQQTNSPKKDATAVC